LVSAAPWGAIIEGAAAFCLKKDHPAGNKALKVAQTWANRRVSSLLRSRRGHAPSGKFRSAFDSTDRRKLLLGDPTEGIANIFMNA
jgi:hypothetical protein